MAQNGERPVLAIDPGREKCGLAVVYRHGEVAARQIVPTADLARHAAEWAVRWETPLLLMGKGTGAGALRKALKAAGLEPVPVAEENTTYRARALYFRDHPPRGWRRLVPLRLQVPPEPLDDYAAVLIADNYFRQQNPEG